MALYKDGNPVSGLNSIPRLTLAQYNALNVKPEFWVRTDAPESYKKLSADQVSYDSNNTVKDMLDKVPFSLSAESGVMISLTDTRCYAIGSLVTISALFTLSSATTAKTFVLASIPTEYKPSYKVSCHAVDNTNDIAVSCIIDNGNIKIYRNGTQSLTTIRFSATYVTS